MFLTQIASNLYAAYLRDDKGKLCFLGVFSLEDAQQIGFNGYRE